jgi:hypothetical protein
MRRFHPAFVAAREKATRWIGVGPVLGLTPLPLGLVLMRYVIQLRQFNVLPRRTH